MVSVLVVAMGTLGRIGQAFDANHPIEKYMSFESRSQLFGAQFESKGESVRALAWVGVRRSVANVYLARIGAKR